MGRAFEVRKHAMAKTSAAKTKLYSRYGKEIYIAAKGNPDPDINVDLRRIIDKAKKDQVPNDLINRAIDKAKGGIDENYIYARYEGFGPSGSLLIIECLTDNVNRTIAEVRHCFTKNNCKLGVSGSNVHMFDHQSVFAVKGISENDALELMIEKEIDIIDIEENEEGVSIYGSQQDYNIIRQTLLDYNKEIDIVFDKIMWIPKIETDLEKDELEIFKKILNMLEEVEDVQDVYHNVAL